MVRPIQGFLHETDGGQEEETICAGFVWQRNLQSTRVSGAKKRSLPTVQLFRSVPRNGFPRDGQIRNGDPDEKETGTAALGAGSAAQALLLFAKGRLGRARTRVVGTQNWAHHVDE